MDMAAKLSDLRQTIPGCHLAAFMDLSARMVLAHDARSKPPQERLDGLADRARRLLNTPDVALNHAIAISEDNLEIFLCSAPASEDSLALVCGVETDVYAAIEVGLALLREAGAHA